MAFDEGLDIRGPKLHVTPECMVEGVVINGDGHSPQDDLAREERGQVVQDDDVGGRSEAIAERGDGAQAKPKPIRHGRQGFAVEKERDVHVALGMRPPGRVAAKEVDGREPRQPRCLEKLPDALHHNVSLPTCLGGVREHCRGCYRRRAVDPGGLGARRVAMLKTAPPSPDESSSGDVERPMWSDDGTEKPPAQRVV